MVRRLVAAGAGVILVILVVLGVKGCLDARKDRAFKDYIRDVGALTQESSQTSKTFFGILTNPGSRTPLDFETDVKSARSAAEGLVTRVSNLSHPDEMGKAQNDLRLSFELRRDALNTIASEIGTALGKAGRREAITRIAGQMQALLASDVIYSQRSYPEMGKGLKDAGIQGVTPPDPAKARFLPSIDWLTATRVAEALARVSGGSKTAAPGTHGLGLLQVVATPGDIKLEPTAPTALRVSNRPTLQVQIQNQGENDESDVTITVTIRGTTKPITLDRAINRIAAGEQQTVSIPLSPAPPAGRELTIDVEAQPVPGEKVVDNNKASYTVTYG